MKRILKIGMDVHSTNYTLCAMEPVFGADDRIYATIQVSPDYKNILLFIEKVKQKLEQMTHMILNADMKQEV